MTKQEGNHPGFLKELKQIQLFKPFEEVLKMHLCSSNKTRCAREDSD